MRSTAIVGYVFDADMYCPHCTAAALEWDGDGDPDAYLERLGRARGFVSEDTYDSSEFPKVIFAYDADSDDYCGGCHEKLLQ